MNPITAGDLSQNNPCCVLITMEQLSNNIFGDPWIEASHQIQNDGIHSQGIERQDKQY